MTRSALIAIVAATAVVALGFGAVLGWFGHRAYIISELEAAFGDIAEDMDDLDDIEVNDVEDAERIGTAEGEVPEPEGPPEPDSDTDGVFTYDIVGVETAASYTDEWGDTTHAQDAYVIVAMEAQNTGDAPDTPAWDSEFETVTAYDAEGRAFAADWEVWSSPDEVNPGTTTSYDIVFDVADDVDLQVLQLGAANASGVATLDLP
jgi:hypothetical protein